MQQSGLKRLRSMNDHLYEVKPVKAVIEQKDPIFVGFFILQYAKLSNLDLQSNFCEQFFDIAKFDELEMDRDSLFIALSEYDLYDCM